MAKGEGIVLNGSDPQGQQYLEGTLQAALYPGQFLEIVPGIEPVGGRFTYRQAQTGSNGDRRRLLVLLEDQLQGGKMTTQIPAGRCFIYEPHTGDELNILFKNIAGTADKFAIGDKAMIDVASGKAIASTGATAASPFTVIETVAAITVDTLIAVAVGA